MRKVLRDLKHAQVTELGSHMFEKAEWRAGLAHCLALQGAEQIISFTSLDGAAS